MQYTWTKKQMRSKLAARDTHKNLNNPVNKLPKGHNNDNIYNTDDNTDDNNNNDNNDYNGGSGGGGGMLNSVAFFLYRCKTKVHPRL